ncbi:hypothetical protein P170DRAFT_512954 [Aspergillus steynii IBT 23096]|uniref:Rhodopsin domain-containing protein n=1 Tax=Aspergillus steynii IBT 23096 TaxID=1392250 RepID=A0A2I2FVY9_9EURO|nr:uncharacterized protein P170DRAFT_512954 [Aspergillus steynii IBT 23096]PLB44809.1 hypothetical protein P170DRAFT_512954 [Aspergillus steynii IBT 23096]
MESVLNLTPEEIAYYEAHADDNRQSSKTAANIVGIVLTLGAVGARLFARYCSRVRLSWDDYLIFLALMGQLSYAILLFMSNANGDGRHMIFVKNYKRFVQESAANAIVYAITVMATKISILFLYRRIFPTRSLVLGAYFVGATVIAYNVALAFVAAFQCVPFSSMWTGEPGKCIGISVPFTIFAVVNVVTDFAILALPVKPVLKLHMRRNRKIQVLTIFLLGGIVCIFGIIRVVAIATMNPVDTSYNAVFFSIWSYLEVSVGILAACLPTFGPLFALRKRDPLRIETHSSSSSRLWKLISSRGRETEQSNLVNTGNSDLSDSWPEVGTCHTGTIQLDSLCEGREKEQGQAPGSPSILVQKDMHQSVKFV